VGLCCAVLVAVVASFVPPPLKGVQISDTITLVPTPFGWKPKQCIFSWPSGTRIENKHAENRTLVTLPNGQQHSLPVLPECLVKYQDPTNIARVTDGWLDNTGYYTNRGSDPNKVVKQFQGYYTVPTTPSASGGLLYYFLGAENKGGNLGLTILQPVLTYYGSWYMNSWNCCPQGQAHESEPLSGFKPGDKVFGNMYETGSELSGDWTVESKWNNYNVTLVVTDSNREFVWIDATLETYYVRQCSQLSSGLMTYSNMVLTTLGSNGKTQNEPITWINYTPTSDCNGVTTVVSSSQVTIKHN